MMEPATVENIVDTLFSHSPGERRRWHDSSGEQNIVLHSWRAGDSGEGPTK